MILKIDILGTKYKIRWVDYGEDAYMEKMGFCGYCGTERKEIVLIRLETMDEWAEEPKEIIQKNQATTMRHEIIHAFFNESGLRQCSLTAGKWAMNEEMVDWIAIQFPKLLKAFKEAGCL